MTFDLDRPISDPSQDKLGVFPFVKRLARPLVAAPPSDSLVVGLYGAWGTGKSSALNLLVNALGELADEQDLPLPIVVRFTPWLYGSVDTLLDSFFATLSTSVGGFVANRQRRNTLSNALESMGDFISASSKLVSSTGPHGAVIGAGVELVAGGVSATSKMIRGEKSFADSRERASSVLRSLGKRGRPMRVVVIIDDVDRAHGAGELLAVLKLVRLVADLPNTSYVIACDRKKIQAILDRETSDEFAEDFLDKIIQVPVSLPPVSGHRLVEVLADEAAQIAAAAGLELPVQSSDERAWSLLRSSSWEGVVEPALSGLRDVNRILNLYRFALLADDGATLDPADLLVLSTLQARYPEVYERLPQSREFLLRTEPDWEALTLRPRESEAQRLQRRRERLARLAGVQLADENRNSWATSLKPPQLEMLSYLFPRVGQDTASYDASRDRAQGRIRSPDRFDGYFRLSAGRAEVPNQEVLRLFDLFVRGAASATDTGWVPAVAATLESYPPDRIQSLMVQLDDRAAAMSYNEAIQLSRSIPPLARHRPRVPRAMVDGLTSAVVRCVLSSTQSDEINKAAFITSLLTSITEALPIVDALNFSERALRDEALVNVLRPDDRSRIARAVIGRQRELEGRDVFGELAALEACGALWNVARLERVLGIRRESSFAFQYVGNILKGNPDRLGDVISLAAAWGQEPSFQRRRPSDVKDNLECFADVRDLIRRAEESATMGDRNMRWSQLLKEFRQMSDQLLEVTPSK